MSEDEQRRAALQLQTVKRVGGLTKAVLAEIDEAAPPIPPEADREVRVVLNTVYNAGATRGYSLFAADTLGFVTMLLKASTKDVPAEQLLKDLITALIVYSADQVSVAKNINEEMLSRVLTDAEESGVSFDQLIVQMAAAKAAG